MPWIAESDAFDCRLLESGALEYRDRFGRYRLAWGCNSQGWHEFWERLELIRGVLSSVIEDQPLDRLYLEHDEFQRHCDRCLELSGVDPEAVSPKLLRWLLFPPDEKTPSPLVLLNTPYENKRPALLGGEAINSRIGFLSALVSACNGDTAAAVELAKSTPARDVMAVMGERAWAMASQEDKDKATLSAAKQASMAQFRDRKRGRQSG